MHGWWCAVMLWCVLWGRAVEILASLDNKSSNSIQYYGNQVWWMSQEPSTEGTTPPQGESFM
jgi:hypothetical protein